MGCAAPNSMHWQDLRARPRGEVLSQPGVRATSDGQSYEVGFLDSLYLVDPTSERISEIYPNANRMLSQEFQILLIRYLVAGNGGPMANREVSEKDLPGGVTFFQGPHTLNVAPIIERYGRDPDAFAARGKELGGTLVPFGDRAVRFLPFPLIPVTYVLWKADEEFPASVSVLFDSSISQWFNLDMIFGLVLVLTDRIVNA
jgi:hypothetical protein